MVSEKDFQSRKFTQRSCIQTSHRVTAGEMRRFSSLSGLGDKVYNVITNYTNKHGIKPKYEGLEELCQISTTSLKKSCGGTQKITRPFLYKLSVGLHMTVDEANELFLLCGGALTEDDIGDYICIKALEDGDDINFFIDQFNEFTRKYDKHLNADKLSKLY